MKDDRENTLYVQERTHIGQAIDITPTQLIDEEAPYGRARKSSSHCIVPTQMHQTQNPIIGEEIARKMKQDRLLESNRKSKQWSKITLLDSFDYTSTEDKNDESQLIIFEEEDSLSDGSSSSRKGPEQNFLCTQIDDT